MKIGKDQIGLNCLWGIPACITTLLLCGWYGYASWQNGDWLGGGSAAGLACGIAAGSVIAFEMLLWPRKFLRRFRFIKARHWMAAHVWFGLASLPLAIAHSGFHLGGALPSWFMILFVLTILSGVYGLILQNVLPRWMLRHLPAETIYSQIDFVSERCVEDTQSALKAACGAPPSKSEGPPTKAGWNDEQIDGEATAVIVGAVRQVGRVRGRTITTTNLRAAPENNPVLWKAFGEIRKYLLQGATAGGPCADSHKSGEWFQTLRQSCDGSSEEVIAMLQRSCDQRRQFDVQRTVHRWLHAWIPVHIGLSVAVTILLGAHIWTALKFW